ncbi:Protein MAIN-LIKE 1 [Glycine soja]
MGRGDRDDFDDAPQRQRPTASARRQRVAITAAHDEPVVPAPDVQDDPMEAPAAVEDIVADIPADTGIEATKDEHEGFPGGSSDPSVLTQYADHVACSVWTREERPELKLSSYVRKVHNTGDRGLLSTFVERWHQETSSFHLPVGELTITLDDASSLLHLPVMGDLHAFEPLHVDDAVQMLVDLLMVSTKSARAETAQCRGPATNVHVVYLEALRDLSMTERYVWGVVALVHMYDQLNNASMSHNRQLGGYITLLQVDCDEEDREEHLNAGVQGAPGPTPDSGCLLDPVWGAPIERIVWQFGYTQTIPAPPVDSWVSYDDIYDRWMHYEDHIVPTGEVCVVPGQCSSDYMNWFFRVSHPFMTPGHALDPLPHGASSTSAEEPRHAVEVCDDIAERLEHYLSLGVVTPGSSTHEVIEECLS